jgi:pimeloyl-ACP methyl ester carboxylesterase
MRRRTLLRLAAGALASGSIAAHARSPRPRTAMAFVLVHGAWHGAWCWQKLVPLLQARGHRVETPVLAGVGERIAELSDAITLDTHIGDVVRLLDARDLREAILVGHSYAGAVILGAADRMAHRLRGLVFLDAVVAGNGARMRLAASHDALRAAAIPPPPAASFGIPDPADRAWVDRHLTPHPARSFDSPLMLANPPGNGLDCAYIACTLPAIMPHARFQGIARATLGCRLYELPTGHDAMVTAPAALAALLERMTVP